LKAKCVSTDSTLRDEETSWAHFERHVKTNTVTLETFDKAYDKVVTFRP